MEHESRVIVSGDRITLEHLSLVDGALARFVADSAEIERPDLVLGALRIGLTVLSNANATLNVDMVRSEFERMTERLEHTNARATEALEQILRTNFADGEGRLPRTLEAFLGDSGTLRRFTAELFDPKHREGAVGRLTDLLGQYFDGDGSRLATLLDPTREGSPLHQFRNEVNTEFRSMTERIAALEAGGRARAEERARGTAKGTDFEDLLEERLADYARGAGDALERTGGDAGDALRSKKGDFVLTVDPSRTRGADLRVVIEAKDRSMSRRAMAAELADAKVNRGAPVAVVVFSAQAAPSGIAPFSLVGNDIYTVFDPEIGDDAALEASVRLARSLALVTLRDASVQVDVPAVQAALEEITQQLAAVVGMKSRLTSISTAAREVSGTLDQLRAGVMRAVRAVEDELRVAQAEEASGALIA
jgi:hypothetical protein